MVILQLRKTKVSLLLHISLQQLVLFFQLVLLLLLSRGNHYRTILSLITGKLALLLTVKFLFVLTLEELVWSSYLDKWIFFQIYPCLCDLQSQVQKCFVLGFLEISKGFIRIKTVLEYQFASLCILSNLELALSKTVAISHMWHFNLNSKVIMLSKIRG